MPKKDSIEHLVKLQLEVLLRLLGLTCASPATQLQLTHDSDNHLHCEYGGMRKPQKLCKLLGSIVKELDLTPPVKFDCINIQLANKFGLTPLAVELVDFGHY